MPVTLPQWNMEYWIDSNGVNYAVISCSWIDDEGPKQLVEMTPRLRQDGSLYVSGGGGENPDPDPDPDPDPPPGPGDTDMISPIDSNWRNYVTSEFGWRDFPADPYHTGIDLAYPLGTSVVAVLSGTVASVVYSDTGYGYNLFINHGNGLQTHYAHNSTIIVSSGDTVTQGQKISEVGATGLVTGPHLHFGVMQSGTWQNPRNYLP